MEVVIFYKTGERTATTFDFIPGEFTRLSSDYENYLKKGLPKEGSYKCSPIVKGFDHKSYRTRQFCFDEIAAIG